MIEILTIITSIIAGISIPLLLTQLNSRKRKDQEMFDKIDSKADKDFVDKEIKGIKETIRDNSAKDAEVHKSIYNFMSSIDRKLDILIKDK